MFKQDTYLGATSEKERSVRTKSIEQYACDGKHRIQKIDQLVDLVSEHFHKKIRSSVGKWN